MSPEDRKWMEAAIASGIPPLVDDWPSTGPARFALAGLAFACYSASAVIFLSGRRVGARFIR